MGVSKNRGTHKSSILIGFSIINHPFWCTPIFGNAHISGQCYLNRTTDTTKHLKKKNCPQLRCLIWTEDATHGLENGARMLGFLDISDDFLRSFIAQHSTKLQWVQYEWKHRDDYNILWVFRLWKWQWERDIWRSPCIRVYPDKCLLMSHTKDYKLDLPPTRDNSGKIKV